VNEGNYSYYLEKRRASEAAAAAAAKAKPAKTARPADNAPEKPDKPRKLKWKEERELEAMEETILAAESAVAELEGKLNDPSFYIANAAEAPAMIEDLERQKAAVAALYSRWEELEAIRALAEAGGGAD
jgi:ATP-binding cassette subfamily F protein uup